jgi:hypothetical protein
MSATGGARVAVREREKWRGKRIGPLGWEGEVERPAWLGLAEKKDGRKRGKWAGPKEKEGERKKEMHSNAFKFEFEI